VALPSRTPGEARGGRGSARTPGGGTSVGAGPRAPQTEAARRNDTATITFIIMYNMYVCIYIGVYFHTCTYIYIHVYISNSYIYLIFYAYFHLCFAVQNGGVMYT